MECLTMKVNEINGIRSQLGWGDVKLVPANGGYYTYLNGTLLTFEDRNGGKFQCNSNLIQVARWLDALLKHNKKSLEGSK